MSPSGASPSASRASPLIGTTLRGTYRILGVLDEGGMGMVFAAEHVRLKRRVAVKLLARHLAMEQHALARFHREAEIISQLSHPHVVQVIDFDTTEQNEPYIVMELLEGESLAEHLDRAGRLELRSAVRIATQVAAGLAAAHASDIVHRDLKPANIFLVDMGDQGKLVKLLDFGISKRAGVKTGITGEFDILGTPDYMAPEQALGRTARVDHYADQYSLAVITYEMIAGETPFPVEDITELLRQVINQPPRPLRELCEGASEAVELVLSRALSKTPHERFPSIADFALALSHAAGTSTPPLERLAVARTVPAPGAPSSTSPGLDRAALGIKLLNVPNVEPSDSALAVTRAAVTGRLRQRSTLPQARPVLQVNQAIEGARQALSRGELDLAATFAESALRLAEESSTDEVQESVREHTELIDRVFEARLGGLGRAIVSRVSADALEIGPTSPEQAYLLSRIERGTTLDELFDLSPLPRTATLRLLVSLLTQGLAELDELKA